MHIKFAALLGYHYFIGSFFRSFQYLLKILKSIYGGSAFIENTVNMKIFEAGYLLHIRASRYRIVTLSGFWLLRGWRDLGESIKKGEFATNFFFPIKVSEVLKTCKKSNLLMYIKAKVKQQQK